MKDMSTSQLPYLQRPVSIGTLVWLRIAVGLLGAFDVLGNGIYYHWYKGELGTAQFHFPYFGFEWVRPMSEPFMSLYFVASFLLGLAVMLGWRFRYTAPAFALAFSYMYLIEKAHYLNHAYLFIWICWLLCLTPAWREWSIDVRRFPKERSSTTPRWCIWIFALLMGVVYFFGGIAKINSDWLTEAMPLRMWLDAKADLPILGPIIEQDWVGYVMAWSGFLLDITAPFLLLGRRSRWWILGFIIFFHLMNHLIFNIGIFPYLSLVLTSLYFDPDWPIRAVKGLGKHVPRIAAWRQSWLERMNHSEGNRRFWQRNPSYHRAIVVGFAVLLLVHIALPLRHHYFGPEVAWTEAGHRYSWRMMLRSKRGYGHFKLVDHMSGDTTIHRPNELHARQKRKMYTHPDMILSYAHHLAEQAEEAGRPISVYADIQVRLNHGEYSRFIDPEVDLSQEKWKWWQTQDWILPPPRKEQLDD